jgi:hypothetical protein
MPYLFSIDDLVARYRAPSECVATGIDRARCIWPAGQRHADTISGMIAAGLAEEDALWFVMDATRQDREALQRMFRALQLLDPKKKPESDDYAGLLAALQAIRQADIHALLDAGKTKSEARDELRARLMASIIIAFEE